MEESSILSKFDSLVESGLVRYDEQQKNVEYIDGELRFQFLLTSALTKKPLLQMSASQAVENCDLHHQKQEGSDISTAGFEIGNISDTHFLIVNKFCFARPHLMLLTSNAHRKQYEPLDENDLEAAWAALATTTKNYVAFYNCGQDGGCSRLHKHLQLMPMPGESFASFLDSKDDNEPNVPFQWFYHRFDSQNITTSSLITVYADLLRRATRVGAGRSEHAGYTQPGAACPHNMILTKRWMIVLPRRRACINKEAGVNALGMLGLIAVATKNEIDNWVRLGLTEALRELGVPR
ncbi:putative ATP adenylyltransferase [Microsporum audouinii]